VTWGFCLSHGPRGSSAPAGGAPGGPRGARGEHEGSASGLTRHQFPILACTVASAFAFTGRRLRRIWIVGLGWWFARFDPAVIDWLG
jgi:hypothetical protein